MDELHKIKFYSNQVITMFIFKKISKPNIENYTNKENNTNYILYHKIRITQSCDVLGHHTTSDPHQQ